MKKLKHLTPEQLGDANGGNPAVIPFVVGYLGSKGIDVAVKKFNEPGPRLRGYDERPPHSLDQTGRRSPSAPLYGPKG